MEYRILNIKGALLDIHQLEDYLRKIASGHLLKDKSDKNTYPIPRLNENFKFITEVYKLLNEHIKLKLPIHPAGEWILDNFYIIDETVKMVTKELTLKKYVNFLGMANGPYAGFARIYVLASEIVAYTDNKINDSYDMYLKANYSLSDYLKSEYSTQFLGKKTNYDFMSNYIYVKDNVLYSKNYGNEKYPNIEKVSGNYEGEKVIRIYNERILKTDKGFYEIMSYFDTKENKTVTTTVKINMLTKYYDEVLTFTYKYVILKDLTIIPINDIMENRVRDYSYDYFLSTFNYESEIRYEE